MKIIKYTDANFKKTVDDLVNRCDLDFSAQDDTVRDIIKAVRDEGDAALLRLTNHFDRTQYHREELEVSRGEIDAAYQRVGEGELEALKIAAENIRRFHERQVQDSWEYENDGVVLGQMVRPLETVGIYVPGGKASYPSSALMNAIPAKVAGVEKLIMCSPSPDGITSPHVLVAADLAGVDSIFKVGGAQAIAAMALGTRLIPKVDKIVGPGNIFVALAKRLVFGLVGIDMIAGPSEILVVADETAHPNFIAADLLSQAEHDEQAVAVLVTPSEELARQVCEEMEHQIKSLSRQAIIEKSLSSRGLVLITQNLDDAIDLANRVAPEHLELAVEDSASWAKKIRNAGAVFVGHYTPEAIGDYLAGPNHVLPTSGTARFSSPLGVYDFLKRTSLIKYSREALTRSAEWCATLAVMEDLDAHANAIKIRITGGLKGGESGS
ncbi:MAG: histidinol dehydrogenase [Nitrospinae bacterium]|nr:histidinol dehydrogenase [Nitrospinota bacterium]